MALQVGDTVLVRGGFGSELPETVTVEAIGDEFGRPVIDYVASDGRSRWAYLYQVEAAVMSDNRKRLMDTLDLVRILNGAR